MKTIIFIFLLIPFYSICQVDTIYIPNDTLNNDIDTIYITNDTLNNDIEYLVSKYKKIIKSKNLNWRLQIKFTSKYDDIIPYKIKFKNLYPEIYTLIIFESPYYKLLAGNFKTKNEALRVKQKIKSNFPAAHPIKYEINK